MTMTTNDNEEDINIGSAGIPQRAKGSLIALYIDSLIGSLAQQNYFSIAAEERINAALRCLEDEKKYRGKKSIHRAVDTTLDALLDGMFVSKEDVRSAYAPRHSRLEAKTKLYKLQVSAEINAIASLIAQRGLSWEERYDRLIQHLTDVGPLSNDLTSSERDLITEAYTHILNSKALAGKSSLRTQFVSTLDNYINHGKTAKKSAYQFEEPSYVCPELTDVAPEEVVEPLHVSPAQLDHSLAPSQPRQTLSRQTLITQKSKENYLKGRRSNDNIVFFKPFSNLARAVYVTALAALTYFTTGVVSDAQKHEQLLKHEVRVAAETFVINPVSYVVVGVQPTPVSDDLGLGLLPRLPLENPVNGINSNVHRRPHPVLEGHPIVGHLGVDMRRPEGTPLLSILTEGEVCAFPSKTRGIYVEMTTLDEDVLFRYQHLLNIGPEMRLGRCTTIKDLQDGVVGYVGNTGLSTGPHLHLEIELSGKKVQHLVTEGYFTYAELMHGPLEVMNSFGPVPLAELDPDTMYLVDPEPILLTLEQEAQQKYSIVAVQISNNGNQIVNVPPIFVKDDGQSRNIFNIL